MEKSKLAVIQDDILAVKYALANNEAFEGLQGDALGNLLTTLQVQRSVVLSATPTKKSKSSGSGKARASSSKAKANHSAQATPQSSATSPLHATVKSRADGATQKAAKRPATAPASSSTKKHYVVNDSTGSTGQSTQGTPKKKRDDSRLRQLRKDIKAGDVVSVLLDVRLPTGWVRSWVEGKITREMTRSGIFEIAFDHDKVAERDVKQEAGHGEEACLWIREQRLEIDHPDFFCGMGKDPPNGIDDVRPRGSWYLHSSSVAGSTGADDTLASQSAAQRSSSGPSQDLLCV